MSRLAQAAGDCQHTATGLSCGLIGFQPRLSSDTSAGGEASVGRLAQAAGDCQEKDLRKNHGNEELRLRNDEPAPWFRIDPAMYNRKKNRKTSFGSSSGKGSLTNARSWSLVTRSGHPSCWTGILDSLERFDRDGSNRNKDSCESVDPLGFAPVENP